ncbi:hypothetical protein [Chenggangzhangella methanolivorans]|uniref:Uncharacterized protein n=1 Tax=Chenggangzhangella methanolivorans TaxID=1437009 RepID=A0A9E6R7X1_9HYPH|nr:hypothetical protein [Chenggangzhangella methanolivorans]QZN99096.1 hypothetical protein K6K41_19930 [Chenggangzhangella methanolivorans]
MNARALELGEIQGNVIAGFNTDIQVLIALTNPTPASFEAAARWISQRADDVTVVSEVRAGRSAIQASGSKVTWLGLAVGGRLLQWMQVTINDNAFKGGMVKRAPSILNDATDPQAWKVGSPSAPVDVFLIVASNDESAAVQALRLPVSR